MGQTQNKPMGSESLSTSLESIISSVRGSNEESQSKSDGDSNANYDEEQFEDEHESITVIPGSGSLQSSSSENYASDDFEVDEHEQETFITGAIEGEVLEVGDGGKRSHSEENDYEDESFEDEQEASQTEKHKVDPQESGGQRQQGGKNDEPHEGDGLIRVTPAVEKSLDPLVRTWCSKKIQELQASSFLPERSQSRLRKANMVVDEIPATISEKLFHRARSARQPRRPHEQRGDSWLRCRQQIKVPTSLMQRVQTQLWMAKSSSECSIEKLTPETLPTSTQLVAPTFCSVKRDNLLGHLATMQLSENTRRWAAPDSEGLSLGMFDFVHNMAARQRDVCATDDATDESEGGMLHGVTVAARLQLEDSIALRNQAEALLGRLPT
ncbi:hypothetical protein JG688_00002795 [Phytophthora aleatoria]|uniref:Uncharacterized protein n=1 Tax=Phytophthora aleatoria TaxID=2496075 RepID=A0A8J5J5A3_9STRA|nr:hypothetical protein JG688_00002795 [Phytophthora aleatoria]